jgi:hypothetical protein
MNKSPLVDYLDLRLTPTVVEEILAEAASPEHLEEHRGWESVGPDFVNQLRVIFTATYKLHRDVPPMSDSLYHFISNITASCATGFLRPSTNRSLAVLASSLVLTHPEKPSLFLSEGLSGLLRIAVETRGELTFVIMDHLLWRAKWKPGRAATLAVYAAIVDHAMLLPMARYFRDRPIKLGDDLQEMGDSCFSRDMKNLRRRQSERARRILVDGFQIAPTRVSNVMAQKRRKPC